MFNKDLGTIRLIVGNRGPRVSVGTKVVFDNIDKLVVGDYTTTRGFYIDGVWHIGLLDIGDYVEIYLEVDNQSSGQVAVECRVEGDYSETNPADNTYTYYIGRTGINR